MKRLDALGSNGFRWPNPRTGPLHLTFHFARVNGRPECVGIDVRTFRESPKGWTAAGDVQPISATLVRSLPVADLIADAIHTHRDLAAWVAAGAKGSNAKARKLAAAQLPGFEERLSGGGRVQWGREQLEKVAEVYRVALIKKDPPVQAVAQAFTRSHSQAAKLVARCRKEGLLAPTRQGKAGGTELPRTRKRG